jgi:hypothetical protein
VSTNHTPGFVPSMLLNAESLLSGHPLNEKVGMTPLEAELLTRALDAVIPVMHTPPETAYSGALTQAPAEHYAGGPDGPIREPGDEAAKWHDVYTLDELTTSLRFHAAKVAKAGYVSAATDINLAAEALNDLNAKLVEARKGFRFDGFTVNDLKRRFDLVNLHAYSALDGQVHVRELRGNTRRERAELLRHELLQLEREIDDENTCYDMDERASGDEP